MTGSEVINRAFRKIRRKAPITTLNGVLDSSTTSVTVDSVDNVGAGSIIEIESEAIRVTAVDRGNKTLTVIRGDLGTTAAAHLDNATVVIDPEFFRIEALELVNECLRDLYPMLFQVSGLDLTYNPSIIGYDLTGYTGGHPLSVQAEVDARSDLWEYVADWVFMGNANTSDFASGKALMLRASLPSAARIRITYPAPFTALADETEDLVTNAGLKDYMEDLPFYYMMGYFLPDREINRSQSEAAQTHQRSQDVPGFLALRTGEWYKARYDDKKQEARSRLMEEVRYIRKTGYGS